MTSSGRGTTGRVIALFIALAVTLPGVPLDPHGTSGGVDASRSLSVWFESPAVKVKLDDLPKVSSAIWDGARISLSAAKGEWESFQAVALASPTATGTVSMAAFTGAGGTIDTSNIDIFQVMYPTIQNKEWPDPLIPLPVTPSFKSNQNNPFLIDIFVPPDTPAGMYYSNVTLSSGSDNHRVPVELRVWNITLPESPTLTTWFDDSGSTWASYYGYTEWSPEHQTLMQNVYRQYDRYKIMPGNIRLGQVGRYNTTITGNAVSVNFTATDPWLEFCIDDLGFRNFRFPLTGYSPRRVDMPVGSGHPDEMYYWGSPPYDMNGTYSNHIGKYIKKVADHYRDKGWLDEAYVYVTDEPVAFNDDVTSYWQHPDYHVVRQYYNLTKTKAPDLSFINTVQMVPELWNHTDVWAVPGSTYHELDAEGRRADGQPVWWYNTDAGIATEGFRGRALYWDTYSRGVDGALYWGTNYWSYNTQGSDPWRGSTDNGNGYLFYPGDNVGIMDDVVPSQRLVLTRDGIEDYELLHMYGERFGVEAARAVAESVAVGSHFAGERYQDIDERLFYEVREWLAGEITAERPYRTWTDTYGNNTFISSFYRALGDHQWEGSVRLSPEHKPVKVDGLDDIGDWHSNDQPSINSSLTIDTAVKTEGTGSLRIEWWRDNDPNVLGGYGPYATNQRNGRVITTTVSPSDWSDYSYLELDVRSEEHVPGYMHMLIDDISGTSVGSRLHPHMRYEAGPAPGWRHVVIDISSAPRSDIQYIQAIQQNYFMEEEWHHYAYWLDNITMRKAGYRTSGDVTSAPIDLGPAAGALVDLEYISQWDLPSGTSLSFDTRTSHNGTAWTSWEEAPQTGRFRAAIQSPDARFIQYRASMSSPGTATPVLSEVRVNYHERTGTDIGLGKIEFDPGVPTEFTNFSISVPVVNNGMTEVAGLMVEFFSGDPDDGGVPLGNDTGDLLPLGSTGAAINWSADNGTYMIFARLSLPAAYIELDPTGDTVSAELLVNAVPTPVANVSDDGRVKQSLMFSANFSYDDTGITDYLWDLDGYLAKGELVHHSFDSPGVANYTLTVKDAYGEKSSVSGTIMIYPRNPRPGFVIDPGKGSTETAFTFDSTTYDPDGTVTRYSWDFGDGETAVGPSVIHTFPDDITYTVSMKVEYDSKTASKKEVSQELTVSNLPPVANITVDRAQANRSVLFTFDALASADPDDPFDSLSFSWDFGDGGKDTGLIVSHAFNDSGEHKVTLRVFDDDDDSGKAQIIVTVLNRLPAANITGPDMVETGERFTLSGLGSVDPDGWIANYTWAFWDGAIGHGPNVTYSFSEAGEGSVILTVTDNEGATASVHRAIEVLQGEVVEPPDGEDDPVEPVTNGTGKEGGSGGSLLWGAALMAAVVAVVVIILILLMLRKRKHAAEEEGEDGANEGKGDEGEGEGEKEGQARPGKGGKGGPLPVPAPGKAGKTDDATGPLVPPKGQLPVLTGTPVGPLLLMPGGSGMGMQTLSPQPATGAVPVMSVGASPIGPSGQQPVMVGPMVTQVVPVSAMMQGRADGDMPRDMGRF